MRPSLGRIVHYLERGLVRAALIINLDPAAPWHVVLIFWDEFGTQHFRAHVPFSREPAKLDKHWWWPPMPKPTVEDMKKLREDFQAAIPKPKTEEPQ
jgi:hypothetical protein